MEEEYGVGVSTDLSFEQAVMRTRVAMRTHGFSILSEMAAPPVPGGTRHHLFMGLWTHLISSGNIGGQGLDVGDHLACNVVVFEEDGTTHVAALEPEEGLEGWSDRDLAGRARQALQTMLESITSEP